MIKLIDILNELNIRQKPQIGRGTEGEVYPFLNQPDKVIKHHGGAGFGIVERPWEVQMRVMKENPDIFTKVYNYKHDPEDQKGEGIIILERVNTEKLEKEIEEMNKIALNEDNKDKELIFFKKQGEDPPTFAGSQKYVKDNIDFINISRLAIGKGNISDIKVLLDMFKPYPDLLAAYKKWLKFIKLVDSKIGVLAPLYPDFSYKNVGYDKQGNLKMFDW